MSDDLDFAGGAGGVTADLMDMRATARVLDDRGTDLSGIAGRARSMTLDGDLLLSVPFSPGSAARAEQHLVEAAALLTVRVVRLEGLALLLRTKADLIELADDAQAFGGRTVEQVGGFTAGVFAVPLTAAALTTTATWFVAGTADQAGEAVLDAVRGDLPLSELDDRLRAAPTDQLGDMREAATLFLRDHPGVTDAVTGGLPGFLNGAAGPYGLLVPDDYEGVLGALLGAGGLLGKLDDRPVTVTGSTSRGALPLEGLEQVWASANALQTTVSGDHDASAVRIVRVQDGGVVRWVVQVPGTQEWNPVSGGDPSDLTSNVELMDDGQAEVMKGVLQAMREAGIQPGQEVMLMGHSQGGITAMALAVDDAVRAEFDVTTVFTGGSPVARFDLPDGVRAVSLEHVQDPVPRLDSQSNPDLPDWTTVTRDVASELAVEDRAGQEAAARSGHTYVANPIASHAGVLYQESSQLLDEAAARADRGSSAPDDVAAQRVRDAVQPFLDERATVVDYRLERDKP